MGTPKSRRFHWVAAAALIAAIVAPSAVLAAGQFSDVPDTNVFSQDIEWLADAGITTGCGGDLFCPDLAVTREQMAAFLHRLATSQVVDAGDSVRLGGSTTEELIPRASAQEDGVTGAIAEIGKGLVEINAVTIDAPEAGVLVISGTAFVNPEGVTTDFILQTKVNGAIVGTPGWSAWFRPASDTQTFELTYTVAEEVSAGTHTVTQLVGPKAGTTDFIHNHETLTVVFVPSGQAAFSSSVAPAGSSVLESETGR